MLVTSKEMLLEAKKVGYAIPAPDFIDLDSARSFVKVAEELSKPIILSYAQAHGEMISLVEAVTIGKMIANNSTVPVCLHLDHGIDLDFIKEAVDLGFTSVMIDASTDCFEENVRKTKEIVEYAHNNGVVVEAEIGHVGSGDNYEDHKIGDSIYTNLDDAVRFVKLTNVDSLAVSIGTAHGEYKGKPKINFELLKKLKENLEIPLVLHGGSGSGDENLHRCAVEGIHKINIFTDFMVGAMQAIEKQKPKNYFQLKKISNLGMTKVLKHYYGVFERNEEDIWVKKY